MSEIFRLPYITVLDSNGDPISGGKVNFYRTGTTTRLDTYSDDARATANLNPVVADASGRAGPVFLKPQAYRTITTDAADVTISDDDPINGAGTGVGWFNVLDYGAIGNGTTDDTTAIQAAIDAVEALAAAGGGVVYLPTGVYLVSATLTIQKDFIHFVGDGMTTTTISRKSDYGDTLLIQHGTANQIIQYGSVRHMSFTAAATLPTTDAQINMIAAHNYVVEDIRMSDGFIGLELAGCHRSFFDKIEMRFSGGSPTGRMFCLVTRAPAGYISGGRLIGSALHFTNIDWDTLTPDTAPGVQYGIKVDGVDGLFINSPARIGSSSVCNVFLSNDGAVAADITGNVRINGLLSDICTGQSLIVNSTGSSSVKSVDINGGRYSSDGNGTTGITISAGTLITMTGVQVDGWTVTGIQWNGASKGSITGGTVFDFDSSNGGTGNGIDVLNGGFLCISGVYVDGNSQGENGIILQTAADTYISVTGCIVTACTNGITVVGAGPVTYNITGNIVLGNSSAQITDNGGAVSKNVGSDGTSGGDNLIT